MEIHYNLSLSVYTVYSSNDMLWQSVIENFTFGCRVIYYAKFDDKNIDRKMLSTIDYKMQVLMQINNVTNTHNYRTNFYQQITRIRKTTVVLKRFMFSRQSI